MYFCLLCVRYMKTSRRGGCDLTVIPVAAPSFCVPLPVRENLSTTVGIKLGMSTVM